MKVKYAGPARDYSGYGEANRHDIAALHTAGVEITTQIPSYTLEISDYGAVGEIAVKAENAPMGYTIKIIHTTPNVYRQFMEPGKYHIGRVFWETDKLPLDFAANVELMDEIWTGSHYNAQAIKNAGVTKPIKIIPEAIEAKLPEVIEPYDMPEIGPEVKFKFYSIFEWTERKNPNALLEAYWREFEGRDDVALVLKTYVDNFTPNKKEEIKNNIRMLKKRLQLNHYAPVHICSVLMDRHQIYRFHKSFDCFVSAHRGEGWGIPQMEALLMGKPVISTAAGGIHEYLIDGIHGVMLPYKLVPIGENSRNKQWYTSDQRWAEVDLDALRAAMRYAFENPEAMNTMGQNGKRLVETVFSLEAVGTLMRKRLTEISNEPYQVDRREPVGVGLSEEELQVGDIIEPEQVVQDPYSKSKFTLPPLVKKNRIKVDYFNDNKGMPDERA